MTAEKMGALIIPRTHSRKLLVWLATAPAREVERVARLGLHGYWKGDMKRKVSVEYIERALRRAVTRRDVAGHARIRAALIKRELLPEGFDPDNGGTE